MKAIILFISMFLLLSCNQHNHSHSHSKPKAYHKLKDTVGYAYQDDNLLWHMFVYNQITGVYDYQTSTTTPAYDSEVTSFSPTAETVSNFGEAAENGMAETTGEATGGSDSDGSDSSSDSGGMSEDSGSDTGGSDSGSDGGGSDGGGGDGGGGGE